jgi:hypothetical protein
MKKAGRKLRRMAILYKNDQPQGIGVMLVGDDARRTLKAFERSYQRFKALPLEIQEKRHGG